MPSKEALQIRIKNAHQNNLKNLDLTLPHHQLIVFTGVSGSGKSSLAYDTLFAEGQRRYMESLSAYVRQFVGKVDKPKVDYIKGLAPSVAIRQKVITANPRSTVGTVTEIYDYLKLLFARIGRTFSPFTGNEVVSYTIDKMVAEILALPKGSKFMVLAKVQMNHEEEDAKAYLEQLLQFGFTRLWIDEEVYEVDYLLKQKWEDFYDLVFEKETFLIIDRLAIPQEEPMSQEQISRLTDSVQTACEKADGDLTLAIKEGRGFSLRTLSKRMEENGVSFEQPSVGLFTFNSPQGACPTCEGFGQAFGIDEHKVIPNFGLSVREDAVACWRGGKMKAWKEAFMEDAAVERFPFDKPYADLSDEDKNLLWNGNKKVNGIMAFFRHLEANSYKMHYNILAARFKGRTTCPTCKGARLKEEAFYVKVGGHTIKDFILNPVKRVEHILNHLKLSPYEQKVAERILLEIKSRVQLMNQLGLGYLNLNRAARTLSGGETQRLQIITSLSGSLTGALYILDEPSVGLHPKDNDRLIEVLQYLRDLENTIIVVEHDEDLIRAADFLVDVGPAAGHLGGELVYAGEFEKLMSGKSRDSLTAQYLLKNKEVKRWGKREVKPMTTKNRHLFIQLNEGCKNNIKNINIHFPLEALTVVSGLSGSGKSTLVREILLPNLAEKRRSNWVNCKSLEYDFDAFDKVEWMSQNPIGRSSRSNPATYIKAFDHIRYLYGHLKSADAAGFSASTFSFNVPEGVCSHCEGEGIQRVEMQFMADLEVTCEFCKGKRYKPEVLNIFYRDKNIADVLEMSVSEAIAFFEGEEAITKALQPLEDVGLGYLQMGQPVSQLSGGEAQRLKLATYLNQHRSKETVLFFFDEPTTGLHFKDVQTLMEVFDSLISLGHSIVVIEHHPDVIKAADWNIDLGKEGGDQGGELMYQGPEAAFATQKENSYTAAYVYR